MYRKLLWAGALSLLCAVAWGFAYGPLFPWSPAQPGYETLRLRRLEITFPRGQVLDPAYLKTDDLLAEGEAFYRLTGPARLRVIACRNWDDLGRFCPFVRGRGVGAATLDAGGVVYVTPRIAEKSLDLAEFLRHEIAHAIVVHNASFWRLRLIKRHSRLYEGMPVWFGRQTSFVTQEEFLSRARGTDLWPVISADANSASPPDIRFSYIAWRDFLDYLSQTGGRETLLRFVHASIQYPAETDRSFVQAYATSLQEMVKQFSKSIEAGAYLPREDPD